MARPRIMCDKTELVLIDVTSRSASVHNLQFDEVTRIQFGTRRELSWFRLVETDSIEIHSRKRIEPFIFSRRRNRQLFDQYRTDLRRFAERNSVTLAEGSG